MTDEQSWRTSKKCILPKLAHCHVQWSQHYTTMRRHGKNSEWRKQTERSVFTRAVEPWAQVLLDDWSWSRNHKIEMLELESRRLRLYSPGRISGDKQRLLSREWPWDAERWTFFRQNCRRYKSFRSTRNRNSGPGPTALVSYAKHKDCFPVNDQVTLKAWLFQSQLSKRRSAVQKTTTVHAPPKTDGQLISDENREFQSKITHLL